MASVLRGYEDVKAGRTQPAADFFAEAYKRLESMSKPVIVSDPEIMRGIPCFRGTRVPFQNLLDYLEDGEYSLNDFLEEFPGVTREMAVASLEEAGRALFEKLK